MSEKHPVYGYLTKDEYERMKNAPYGTAKDYLAIAKKRESIAKRKKPQPVKK